jgi:DNA-binding response OmpR family regulator
MSMGLITVKVLLVTRDIEVIETLSQSMARVAMHVEVCSEKGSATRRLCRSKFEGVAIDLKEGTGAVELVSAVHQMTSHRGAVVIAILDRNDDAQNAFLAGANFILERPFSPGILMPTLKASYSLMLRERRRYFRCPVRLPIYLTSSSGAKQAATSVNISEGGMALTVPDSLKVGEALQLSMTLPGTDRSAEMSGEVCWADTTGSVGIEFGRLSSTVSEMLQSWLFERLRDAVPEVANC